MTGIEIKISYPMIETKIGIKIRILYTVPRDCLVGGVRGWNKNGNGQMTPNLTIWLEEVSYDFDFRVE